MKKIALALFTMLFLSTSIFAQADLQVLAVVKHYQNESITVKQLKKRVTTLEKQAGKPLTLDERKKVLNTLIEETLVVQAAHKAGFSITDSMANQYYEATISQLVGIPLTESQFEELVQSQFGMTSDQFFKENLGVSKNDFKEQLRTQLLIQQYITVSNRDEALQVKPTDEQIRLFYEANKSSLIWNDMADMLIVAVPNEENESPKAAEMKANELRNKYIDKKITSKDLQLQSKAENSGYIASEGLIEKSKMGAQMLGIPMEELIKLFSQDVGFVSDIIKSDAGYTFLSLVKKYDAKMLKLSDTVQPGSTTTVYEYIRGVLTNQLQGTFLQGKLEETAAKLNVPENVDIKKSGEALDKLLSWGE